MAMKLSRMQIFASTVGLMVLSAGGVALATPGSGFSNTPYPVGHFGSLNVKADKDQKWDLFLRTKDDTDIGVDRLTVAPGGHSGWHSHAGPVFVTVTQGSIVRYDGSTPGCPATTYLTGHTFVEDPNLVHMIRNASTTDSAEFVAIQMRPEGAPGRVDEPQSAYCT
jgi:quercetin dioxygenase-like cupin family protein